MHFVSENGQLLRGKLIHLHGNPGPRARGLPPLLVLAQVATSILNEKYRFLEMSPVATMSDFASKCSTQAAPSAKVVMTSASQSFGPSQAHTAPQSSAPKAMDTWRGRRAALRPGGLSACGAKETQSGRERGRLPRGSLTNKEMETKPEKGPRGQNTTERKGRRTSRKEEKNKHKE